LFLIATEAPASINNLAIFLLLKAAVICKAVSPFLFFSAIEHLALMSILAIPAWQCLRTKAITIAL